MPKENEIRKKYLGKDLRDWRIKLGLTQWDVARGMGYTTAQFISNWERGVSYPPNDDLRTLAGIFKIKPLVLGVTVCLCKEKELAQSNKELLAALRRS